MRPSKPEARADPGPTGGPELTSRRSSSWYGLSTLRPVHAALDSSQIKPGPRYDMHLGLEFGVVLAGRMRRYYRSWETEVGAGQAWLCGMWERHGWEITASPCSRLVFVILPMALHQARSTEAPGLDWMAPFRVAPQERPQAQGRKCDEILAIARRVGARVEEDAASPLRLIAALELLLELVDGWRPPRRYPPIDESYYGIAEKAIEYALNAPGMVTTHEAAAACAMSPRVFGKVFETLLGIPFAHFVLRHRLSEAAAQLLTMADAVADIATRCGFSHRSHFSHSFTHHYGISPTAYRQTRRRQ